MNVKILGWLAAAGMLFVTACSTDEPAAGASGNNVAGEEVTVSFSVSPAGRVVTRAGSGSTVDYPNTENHEYAQISDGTKAHVLIYAVYDDQMRLLEQYGNELTGDVKTAAGLPSSYVLGEGQTLLYIPTFPTEEPIKLRLMRNQTYYIAFWAQAAECTAYDTKDLTKVKVSYADAKSNDEFRDAFCAVEVFSVASDEERDVILTRPLAQINVGTAGYDFEAAVKEGAKYFYSKISVDGVSEYLDVVANKVLISQDDFESHGLAYDNNGVVDVDYDWARIPAYVNFGDDASLFAEGADGKTIYPNAQTPEVSGNWKTAREQFLRVDRDFDGLYNPYVSLEDYENAVNDTDVEIPDTETYKYLAMCYVLVPSQNNNSTTVDNVTVKLAPAIVGENNSVTIDESATGVITIVNDFSNVPVQWNWRTNILSKNLLTVGVPVVIDIIPDFQGEYNQITPGEFGSYEFPEDDGEDDAEGEEEDE